MRWIASADQRIVLHNKDRGCTFPGCDMPGYLSEVHHCEEWAGGGHTNIDKLTFGYGQHHALLGPRAGELEHSKMEALNGYRPRTYHWPVAPTTTTTPNAC